MVRLALIIKGHSNSETEAQSDILFVKSYYQFLNSISGGAWEENEIIFLDEPEFSEYVDIVNSFKPSYAVTVLIGHGATINDHQLFKLNENVVVKPGQFILDTPKQLIILESCRSYIDQINWVDLENKIPGYRDGGYVRGHINRETSKHLFITRLNQCYNGIVTCFACSKDQVAYNYFFSAELIQFGQDLFLDTNYHYMTFDILNMMPHIIKKVSQKAKDCGVEQIPETHGDISFPFAVSKFDLLDFEREELNVE